MLENKEQKSKTRVTKEKRLGEGVEQISTTNPKENESTSDWEKSKRQKVWGTENSHEEIEEVKESKYQRPNLFPQLTTDKRASQALAAFSFSTRSSESDPLEKIQFGLEKFKAAITIGRRVLDWKSHTLLMDAMDQTVRKLSDDLSTVYPKTEKCSAEFSTAFIKKLFNIIEKTDSQGGSLAKVICFMIIGVKYRIPKELLHYSPHNPYKTLDTIKASNNQLLRFSRELDACDPSKSKEENAEIIKKAVIAALDCSDRVFGFSYMLLSELFNHSIVSDSVNIKGIAVEKLIEMVADVSKDKFKISLPITPQDVADACYDIPILSTPKILTLEEKKKEDSLSDKHSFSSSLFFSSSTPTDLFLKLDGQFAKCLHENGVESENNPEIKAKKIHQAIATVEQDNPDIFKSDKIEKIVEMIFSNKIIYESPPAVTAAIRFLMSEDFRYNVSYDMISKALRKVQLNISEERIKELCEEKLKYRSPTSSST